MNSAITTSHSKPIHARTVTAKGIIERPIFNIILKCLGMGVLISVNHGNIIGNLAFVVLAAGMVFFAKNGAVKAFSIVALAPILNTAFVDNSGGIYSAARLGLFGLVGCKLTYEQFKPENAGLKFHGAYLKSLILFCGVSGLLAIISGYYVQIALLKLVSYLVGMIVVGAAINNNQKGSRDLDLWFYAMFLMIALLGLASLGLGVAYNAKGEIGAEMGLFNGAFYHPNCMGPMAAMIILYLACMFFWGKDPNRFLTASLIAVFIYLLFLTKSRTAFGVFIAGMGLLLCAVAFTRNSSSVRIRLNFSFNTILCAVAVLLVGTAIFNYFTGTASLDAKTYLLKGSAGALDFETVTSSRAEKVGESWDNFKASPWIGIGFETSKDAYFVQNATTFSAPIEKGFLPTAVLEEVGIIGTFCFAVFLTAFFSWFKREHNMPGVVLLFGFLMVNMGEAMFFSFGGHGAFSWVIVVAAGILGPSCLSDALPAKAAQVNFHRQNRVATPS